MADDEQIKTWLTLLTLNLLVMSSLLLEIMGGNLNTTHTAILDEVNERKWLGQTPKQQ